MALRRQPVVMLFDGVPELPGAGWAVQRVRGPLEAAHGLTSRPRLLVISGESGWQRELVARLPDDRRPAVIVLGGQPDARLADDWLSGPPSEDEAASRVQLALSRARARRRLARRAFIDPLTGLPNRRALIRGLVREAARARRSGVPVALMLVDLDGFKQVNERQGHAGGDRLLRKVGATLRAQTREDELCGRIGGDEFALVLRADERTLRSAERRLRRALRDVGVSASVACAALGPREPLRALYRRCDALLFAAKARRRLVPQTPANVPPAHVIAGARRPAERTENFLALEEKEDLHDLGMQ